jgi:hypothetical protein
MMQTGFKSTILKEGYKDMSEKFGLIIEAKIKYIKVLQEKEPDQKILMQIGKETDLVKVLIGFMEMSENLIETLEEEIFDISQKNAMNKKCSDFYRTEYEDYFEKYYKAEDQACQLEKTLSQCLTTLSKASNQELIMIRESLK